MIGTVARIMWLGLWRDRGALALAFVLPPLMFLVFAEVFSGAGEDDLELRVAIADTAGTAQTGEIASAVSALDGIVRVRADEGEGSEGLERAVRLGRADAAVWLRAPLGGDLDADPPIVVIGDASRELAAAIVVGRVQQLLRSQFPDIGIRRAATLIDALAGPYTDEQRESIEIALAGVEDEEPDADATGAGRDGLVERQLVGGGHPFDDGVSYYAGAVTILFLLFATMQGAISVIDERSAGIVDRLMAGPGGYTVVVVGKGLFLTLQGVLQAALIFAFAWLLYDLDWLSHFGAWLVTALLAASVAAWLALLLASLCSTRQQAQTASAFVVLILSAVGGSMMPRFLMPGWLRDLGWATPNAWVIESWQGIFWRGDGVADLAVGWTMLATAALAGMLVTLARTRRLADAK